MRRLNVMHGFLVGCGLQKFFEITSFRTTLSSACSPTSLSSWRCLPPTGAKVWRQGGACHRTCCAICKRSHPKCHADGKDRHANASLGLPQDPNNLFFGESATFHFCAPMSETLTFQWHTFRGEGQIPPISRHTNDYFLPYPLCHFTLAVFIRLP